MFLGLWGRMRKRRDEKKKELERVQEEKRVAKERLQKTAFDDFAAAREAHRQRLFQRDIEAAKASSTDARRIPGTLSARRFNRDAPERTGYQNDTDTDTGAEAVRQFLHIVAQSSSCSDSASPVSSSSSDSSSSCSTDSGSSSDSGGSCGSSD